MIKKGYLKPALSVQIIGKKQFWMGIILGVVFSFILSYFINYSRETLRFITYIGEGPFILSDKEFRLYDLFFAAFSTSIGFGITIIFWMLGRDRRMRKRYLKPFILTSACFIILVSFSIVARFGSILQIILYSRPGYDNHLDFLNEFTILIILIPVFIFLSLWNNVILVFKAQKWLLISIVVFIGLTFYLFKTTYVDRDELNQSYYSKHKYRYNYIEEEFMKARKLDVFFSDETENFLKRRTTESAVEFVKEINEAFETEGLVSLDTLILEKIILHNHSHDKLIYYPPRLYDGDINWHYALPEEIYFQIIRRDVNSPELEVLFQILSEQISLFTRKDLKWEYYSDYSHYEIESSMYSRNLMYLTRTIQSRLYQVVNKLRQIPEYEKYYHLIPEFDYDDSRRSQEYFDLNL